MLDTSLPAATPEGVELALRPAGPVPRALAWGVDVLWRAAVLMLLSIVLSFFGKLGLGIFLIAWFALEWLVPAWFEAYWDGATPGKKALGLRVIADDGAPIGWGAALSRNLLRFADFLPVFYLGGLASMLCNRQFKRLGDFVAGTLVVHDDRPPPRRPLAAAPPLALQRALSSDEVRVVRDLAERAEELGRQRTLELLEVAAPVLGGRRTPQELLGIAHHLAGSGEAPRAPG